MIHSKLNKIGITYLISILSASPLFAENSDPIDSTAESETVIRKIIYSSSVEKGKGKGNGQLVTIDSKPISSVSDLKGLSPTQSYYKIHSFILNANSYDQIKPFLTKKALTSSIPNTESRSRVDPVVREEQMFVLVKAILSSKVKITDETIEGEKAVLKAIPLTKSIMEKGFDSLAQSINDSMDKATVSKSSTFEERGNTLGTIVMKVEDGVWKIDRENWRTKLEPNGKISKAKNEIHIWCEESSDVDFSKKPATGKIYGKLFAAKSAEYSQTVNPLKLVGPGGDKWNRPSITLFLFNKGKLPLGQVFKTSRRDLFGSPHVHIRYLDGKKIARKVFTGSHHYGLKLHFDKTLSDGMLTGYIVLRLPESSKSEINGYFHAKVK